MATYLVWLYAGFLAGVLAGAIEEPAYATLFVFPLMFAVGEPPPVVILSFTISTGVAGALNLAHQVARGARPRLTASITVPPLLGVATGVAVWALVSWDVLRVVVGAAMALTGARIWLGRNGTGPRRARLLLNFLVGFTDAIMGTTASFALAKAMLGELEALLPTYRVVEAAASVALKQKIVIGGFLAGTGVYLGQNMARCSPSSILRKAVAAAVTASGIYILVA